VKRLNSIALFFLINCLWCFSASATEFIVLENIKAKAFPEREAKVVGKLKAGWVVYSKKQTAGWVLIVYPDAKKSIKGWVERKDLHLEAGKENGGQPRKKISLGADPSRVFYNYTAFNRPKGTFSAKGHYLGIWNFEYSVSDNLSLAFNTLLPVGIFGFGGGIKYSQPLMDKVRVGAFGEIGSFLSIFDIRSSAKFFYYYTGALVSFGTERSAFTFSPAFLGGGGSGADSFLFILTMNYFYTINDIFKLILDLNYPITTSGGFVGDFVLLGYGFRVYGDNVAGDVGFAMPIYSGMGGLLKYLPFGIPFISLSFVF